MLVAKLPAMYFSLIPVQIIKKFSIIKLIPLLAAKIIFVSIAFFSFYYGLKKYESENLITKKFDLLLKKRYNLKIIDLNI